MFNKDYTIGLDIGSSSMKLVQFQRKEDGLYLIKEVLRELGKKEPSVTLKELLKGINIKSSDFIVSINCPKTCVRITTAPYMPKKELRDGVRLAAKNFFPFAIDQALLDFEILGEVTEEGVRKYKLLVATSPKETVEKFLSLLGSAGIKPTSFVTVPLALQRVIEKAGPKKDQIQAALDIGENFTELVIFSGKELVFSRKIPVAGKDFTKSLTNVLVSDMGKIALSIDEAEKVKREVGIPQEGESKIIDGKISTTQILSMIRSPVEHLVNEVERCFDYYREETSGDRIDSLLLFGGGASLKGLPEFLSKELGIEAKVGDSYRFAPAIGAALSLGKGINLLPPEIKGETKRSFKRAGLLAVATAVILISAFTYIGMRIKLVNFQKRIGVAQMELASLQPQLKLAETQSLANAALADEPYWEDLFKELSNIIPRDIYLTEFSMEERLIRMKGIVASKEEEMLLSNFILTLERGIFKDVKLVTTEDMKEAQKSKFELKCWVD